MPVKHASSHGFATLLGTIAAGLLVEVAKTSLPALRDVSDRFSAGVASLIGRATGLELSPEVVSIGLLAAVLAAVWGFLWSFMHGDR